jgi:hypothetical protein
MRFSRNDERLRSGRFPKRAPLVLVLLSLSTWTLAQTPKPAAKKAAAQRANELTLAGLRPGRDSLTRAQQLNRQYESSKSSPGSQSVWLDACKDLSLTLDNDTQKKIQVIRVGYYCCSTVDCAGGPPSPWKTGLGLRVNDPAPKVARLYGEPDSKSPSSRDGQKLELWYYAFDWAGADVPQVMEVLCTRQQDGTPGRVIEITLAAPSL